METDGKMSLEWQFKDLILVQFVTDWTGTDIL